MRCTIYLLLTYLLTEYFV